MNLFKNIFTIFFLAINARFLSDLFTLRLCVKKNDYYAN